MAAKNHPWRKTQRKATNSQTVTRKMTAAETCGADGCPVTGFYVRCEKCEMMIQPNFPPSDKITVVEENND